MVGLSMKEEKAQEQISDLSFVCAMVVRGRGINDNDVGVPNIKRRPRLNRALFDSFILVARVYFDNNKMPTTVAM
jgi:hypothetical protein